MAGTFLTAIYILRVAKQIFWGPLDEGEHSHLPDAEGPEWVSLVVLSGVLILFGVLPALAIAPVDSATVALLDRLGVLP